MTPDDLARLAKPSDPRLSPDGSTVAFTVTRPDLDTNTYRSAVWTVAVDGSTPPTPRSAGTHRDERARWSSDGGSLAFVSHRPGAGSQLLVLPLGGGEARTVASSPEDIDELAWSPDGRWVAFAARHRDETIYAPDKDDDRPSRRITRMGWRTDGIGWQVDRPRALWVVAADGTSPSRRVVGGVGERDVTSTFSWSPDSTRLVFAQGRHDDADLDLAVDLWIVAVSASDTPADDGALQRLTESSFAHDFPTWSPDGRTIAAYRWWPMAAAQNPALCRIDLATGSVTDVAAVAALDRGPAILASTGLHWDGDEIVHLIEDRGASVLCRDGVRVVDREAILTGYDVGSSAIALTVSTATVPGRVVVVDRDGSNERTLATFAAPFTTFAPERFEAVSADGTVVDAWLVRPAAVTGEVAAGARVPVLLNIHGGPYTQYGHGFFDEFQVQAAAGYAVLYANPRGSSGYGERWGQAIRGPKCVENAGTGWGSVDAEDVLAAVDTALARWPFLDPERVGVLGGSYGGYLTSWLVGHTDRFRAACSERAVNNVLSMRHTSDIGWWFNVSYLGSDEPDDLLACSPVAYADAITTPLLILHSEQDYRCPIEQAEDLFLRLRQRRHDVEFVRFPGEGHELSRSGSPKHRHQRFEILLDFFAKHLQPAP